MNEWGMNEWEVLEFLEKLSDLNRRVDRITRLILSYRDYEIDEVVSWRVDWDAEEIIAVSRKAVVGGDMIEEVRFPMSYLWTNYDAALWEKHHGKR